MWEIIYFRHYWMKTTNMKQSSYRISLHICLIWCTHTYKSSLIMKWGEKFRNYRILLFSLNAISRAFRTKMIKCMFLFSEIWDEFSLYGQNFVRCRKKPFPRLKMWTRNVTSLLHCKQTVYIYTCDCLWFFRLLTLKLLNLSGNSNFYRNKR